MACVSVVTWLSRLCRTAFAEGHMRPTVAKSLRDGVSRQVGDVNVAAGTYYKEISLCPACYSIYTMLDRARTLLKESENSAPKSSSKLLKTKEIDPEVGGATIERSGARRLSKVDGRKSDTRPTEVPAAKKPQLDVVVVAPASSKKPTPAPSSSEVRKPRKSVEGTSKGLKSVEPSLVASSNNSVSLPTLGKSLSSTAPPQKQRPFELPPSDKLLTPAKKQTVPLRSASPPPDTAGVPPRKVVSPHLLSSTLSGQDDDDDSGSVHSADSEGDGWRGRVLLADVDSVAVRAAKEYMCSAGYSVRIVTQGPRVLGLTRGGRYDALLVAT
jgi:CheY-like chemotaxis protein